MTSEQRQRDLEDTDFYEVGMFPAPPPPAAPRPAIAPARATAPRWPSHWEPPFDTSGLAILAATTLLVFGIVGAVVFAMLLAIWDALARLSLGLLVQLETVESTRIVIATLLGVAIVQVIAAIGVFAHRGWARLTGVAISVPATVLGTLLLVAAVSRGLTLETWLAAIVLAAYALSFFGLVAGNSHFRRVQRRY